MSAVRAKPKLKSARYSGPKTGKPKMTPRQDLFCREYMVDLVASKAAVRAGYAPANVAITGVWLMKKPHIQKRIQELKDERARVVGITAERVLDEIAVVAFSDLKDILEQGVDGVKLKPFDKMPLDASRALDAVQESQGPSGNKVAVKLHDKMRALNMLAAHLGICKEQVDLSGRVDTELTIKVVKV